MTGATPQGPAPVRSRSNEPTLDELLAEPIIRLLMQRDRTDEAAIRLLLQQIAATPSAPRAEDDPGADDPTRFVRLLQETARALRERCERELRIRVPGLSGARCAVLVHLAQHQRVNQATLADSLGVRPITLVRLLDRLEADGLVARLPDPGDRRAHLLVLTAKAQPIVEYAYELARNIYDHLQLGISKAEASQLRTLLHRIRSTLSCRGEAVSCDPRRAPDPV